MNRIHVLGCFGDRRGLGPIFGLAATTKTAASARRSDGKQGLGPGDRRSETQAQARTKGAPEGAGPEAASPAREPATTSSASRAQVVVQPAPRSSLPERQLFGDDGRRPRRATTTTRRTRMTSPTGRIYATALTLFTFFVTWAVIAAHPWPRRRPPRPTPVSRRSPLARRSCGARASPPRGSSSAAGRPIGSSLQSATRRSQPRSKPPRPPRSRHTFGSDRQPAGRDGHELVMTRRRSRRWAPRSSSWFRPMRPRSELAAAEAEFPPLEGLLTRFDPSSELSCLNEAGSFRAGPELLEVVELALAGPSGDRRPLRPHRPRRRGSGRLRHGRSTSSRADGPTPPAGARGGGAVRVGGRPDRARARASASTSGGSARATPRSGLRRSSWQPAPVSSTPAAMSRSAASVGRSA